MRNVSKIKFGNVEFQMPLLYLGNVNLVVVLEVFGLISDQ